MWLSKRLAPTRPAPKEDILWLEEEKARQQRELWERLDRVREQLATIDRRKGTL